MNNDVEVFSTNPDAMKHLIQIILVYFGLLTATAFITNPKTAAYEEEIKSWHKKKLASLKAENGWPNLTGLFWPEDVDNKVGGATTNGIILPKCTSDPYIGSVLLVQKKWGFSALQMRKVSLMEKKSTGFRFSLEKNQLFSDTKN